MKILLSNTYNDNENQILLGIGQVLTSCGHNVIMWNTDKKSTFDAFDEFEPDIFFTQLEMLNKAMVKCIEERPALRVVCKIFAYEYVNEEQLALMEQLLNADSPDLAYTSHSDESLFDDWTGHGVDVIPIMNAANIFSSVGGIEKQQLKSELLIIEDKYAFTEPMIKEYFNQFLDIEFKHAIKVFGRGDWVGETYCGPLLKDFHKDAYASTDICIHLNHSDDISQNLFDLLSMGTFCVSNYKDVLEKILPDELVLVNNKEEMKETVDHFFRYPDERSSFIARSYAHVIQNHTYFNRVDEIFKYLDMPQTDILNKTFEDVKERLYIKGVE